MKNTLRDIILICAILAITFYILPTGVIQKDIDPAINNLLSITSSLMGILLAAVALLYSFKQNPKMERLQKSTQYPALLKTYTNALYWSGLALLVGVLIQFLTVEDLKPYWFLASLTILSIKTFNVIRITEKLLLLS